MSSISSGSDASFLVARLEEKLSDLERQIAEINYDRLREKKLNEERDWERLREKEETEQKFSKNDEEIRSELYIKISK